MNKYELYLILKAEIPIILKSFVDKKYDDGTIYHIIANFFLNWTEEMYSCAPDHRALLRDSIRSSYKYLNEKLDKIDDRDKE